MRCAVTQLGCESVGLKMPPFVVCTRGNSSYHVVNSVIGYKNFSCTEIAHEDVRLCPFYKYLYKKERILFTRLLCSIDFNKTPPFLTSTNI